MVLLLVERPARADGSMADLMIAGAAAMLAPSEFGAEITGGGEWDRVAPVLGWAYQWPLPIGSAVQDVPAHRLAFALEWAPGGAGADVRGRLAYRHVRGPLELGLGVVTGPEQGRLSPELGFRFWRGSHQLGAVHVRARVDVAPAAPEAFRAAVTLGWDLL
jgi:hypothetical protein